MDWQKHYDLLIERARHRNLEGYTERHHVVPRCLGGRNHSENLVVLTPEEHFIAHLLLVKLHPGNVSLVRAAYLMTVVSGRLMGRSRNRAVGWFKREANRIRSLPEVREAHRVRSTNDPRITAALKKAQDGNRGVPRKLETKDKLKDAHKKSPAAQSARRELSARKVGVPRSAETRAKVSVAHLGRKHTDEHRAAISAALKGKPKSAEHNAKVAAAATGRPGTRRGAILSDETKQKMREAQLRRLYPDGVIPAKHVPDPAHSARAHKAWATKRAKAHAEAEKD